MIILQNSTNIDLYVKTAYNISCSVKRPCHDGRPKEGRFMRSRKRHLKGTALKIDDCLGRPGIFRVYTSDSVPKLTRKSLEVLCRQLENTGVCEIISDKPDNEGSKRVLLECRIRRNIGRRKARSIVCRTLRRTSRLRIVSEYTDVDESGYEETNRRSSRHPAFLPAPAR
jgi:hypothetical protein